MRRRFRFVSIRIRVTIAIVKVNTYAIKKNNNIISIPIGLRGLTNNYLCDIIPKHSNI